MLYMCIYIYIYIYVVTMVTKAMVRVTVLYTAVGAKYITRAYLHEETLQSFGVIVKI